MPICKKGYNTSQLPRSEFFFFFFFILYEKRREEFTFYWGPLASELLSYLVVRVYRLSATWCSEGVTMTIFFPYSLLFFTTRREQSCGRLLLIAVLNCFSAILAICLIWRREGSKRSVEDGFFYYFLGFFCTEFILQELYRIYMYCEFFFVLEIANAARSYKESFFLAWKSKEANFSWKTIVGKWDHKCLWSVWRGFCKKNFKEKEASRFLKMHKMINFQYFVKVMKNWRYFFKYT